MHKYRLMKKAFLFFAIAMTVSMASYSQTTLTLEESISLALENNKNLKNSFMEVDAAKETLENARSNYYPKVSANVLAMQSINSLIKFKMEGGDLPVYDGNPDHLSSATEYAYFPGINLGLLSRTAIGVLNIAQPVYAGGKIRTGNELAALNVDVKEQQQQLATSELSLKTEEQYWQIISLQEKEKTLAYYELLLRDIRKQVDDALKAGLIIKNDVLKVQIRQSELEANKNKLMNGKKLAIMQFCQTIGIPFDSTLVLQERINVSQSPGQFYTNPENAVGNTIEYGLLGKSVDAARLQTKMKEGDLKPTIAAGLVGYHFNLLQKGVKAQTNGLAYVTVSVPISDLWSGKSNVRESKLREQIAENTFEDTKGLLQLRAEKAWTDLNEKWKEIAIMEETAQQADENLKVSQTGYNSGVVTLSDLLEAQALVAETADKLTEAKMQYRLAIKNYLKVTGRYETGDINK